MADLRDFTGKNRKFTGAAGIKTSDDGLGTGDRVNEKGRIRFNDTTDLLEYYNGTDWSACLSGGGGTEAPSVGLLIGR